MVESRVETLSTRIEAFRKQRVVKKITKYVTNKVQAGETDIPAKKGLLRIFALEAHSAIWPKKNQRNFEIVEQVRDNLGKAGIYAVPYAHGDESDGFDYRFVTHESPHLNAASEEHERELLRRNKNS